MFVFGTIGNSLVSIAALRQHRSMENKIGRTNVHMMVLHLTIAGIIDLLLFKTHICHIIRPEGFNMSLFRHFRSNGILCCDSHGNWLGNNPSMARGRYWMQIFNVHSSFSLLSILHASSLSNS